MLFRSKREKWRKRARREERETGRNEGLTLPVSPAPDGWQRKVWRFVIPTVGPGGPTLLAVYTLAPQRRSPRGRGL